MKQHDIVADLLKQANEAADNIFNYGDLEALGAIPKDELIKLARDRLKAFLGDGESLEEFAEVLDALNVMNNEK